MARQGAVAGPGPAKETGWIRPLIAISLGAAILVVDLVTPASIPFATLYVLVLLIAGNGSGGDRIWIWAAGCMAAATIGSSILTPTGQETAAIARFAIEIITLACTALLIARQSRAQAMVQRQSRVLDVAGSAILLREATGTIILWNRAAEQLYGWSSEEAVGRNAEALLAPGLPEPAEAIASQMARNGVWEGEVDHRRRDGSGVTVLSRWTLQPQRAGLPPLIVEANVDAHAQRAAEALRLSELRYRTIFDTLAVAIWELDFDPVKRALDGLEPDAAADLRSYLAANVDLVRELRAMVRIIDVNETALAMVGVTHKADFFACLDEALPEDDDSFVECLVAISGAQPTFLAESRIRTREGSFVPVIAALSFPPGAGFGRITGCLMDISDRLRMQATIDRTRSELDQAMRAASLGELSASIAHEVNQPLSGVMSYANASRRWLDRDPPNIAEAREALANVVEATQTASEVVKRVRKLLGKMAPERAPLTIDAVVTEAAKLIESEAETNGVVLQLDLHGSGARILGDRILLQQVLINLINNAVQAMDGTDRARRVLVRTERAGRHARIAVIDSGRGLTGEALERAFDAFFTTKDRGMGLGLSMCRSTVEAHEGTIAIAPNPDGPGATVTVELPLLI